MEDDADLEAVLSEKLTDLKAENNDEELKQHEKYLDLQEKIWESLHPGNYKYISIHVTEWMYVEKKDS